jgi:Niemann-Pick C1 protein
LDGELIQGDLFDNYLTWFLMDNPHEDCAKGGHAAYSLGVSYDTNLTNGRSKVKSSSFMTYHTILKTSNDFTEAMREARVLADNITATLRER